MRHDHKSPKILPKAEFQPAMCFFKTIHLLESISHGLYTFNRILNFKINRYKSNKIKRKVCAKLADFCMLRQVGLRIASFFIILKNDAKTEESKNDLGSKQTIHTVRNLIKVIINSTLYNPGPCLSILSGSPFIWHWRRLELNNNLQDRTERLWQVSKFISTTG